MRRSLQCAALVVAALVLTTARGEDTAKSGTDQTFVHKATAGGLAEVNHGTIAAKQASAPAVKEFAEKMVQDHEKANKELLSLANKKELKSARSMDAKHEKMSAKLLKLSGAEFDREYMAGQVKDHEETIALFENEAKNGKDEELSAWAKKTLPDLRHHLKMAKAVQGKLEGGKGSKTSER